AAARCARKTNSGSRIAILPSKRRHAFRQVADPPAAWRVSDDISHVHARIDGDTPTPVCRLPCLLATAWRQVCLSPCFGKRDYGKSSRECEEILNVYPKIGGRPGLDRAVQQLGPRLPGGPL